MSNRLDASSFNGVPRGRVSEQDQMLSESEAFIEALETCPIDNRRRGENFRDTFVEVRPKPPREGAPFIHGDQDGVCKVSEGYLRQQHPAAFARYGALNVRLKLLDRLTEMERIRREGRAPKEGAKTAKMWNPGG